MMNTRIVNYVQIISLFPIALLIGKNIGNIKVMEANAKTVPIDPSVQKA